MLPEHQVCPGQQLQLVAHHDTYGISFDVVATGGDGPQPTSVPLFDAAWKAAHDGVWQLQSRLMQAATQQPHEYRRLVNAALLLAMQPWAAQQLQADEERGARGTGGSLLAGHQGPADPHHAAALLVRLMT